LGMPWSMASLSMVYNPEILASAGWDQAPVTLAEFEQCLADIKAMDSEIIPYAVSTKDATCAGDFMPWLWTFGGSVYAEDGSVALDSPEAVACVKWYQDMLGKGFISMDVARSEARQMFAQGKVAFYDDAVVAKGQAVSNGVSPDEVVNVCSAMLRPVLNAGDAPQSTMWGHMLVIFANSDQKEAALELAKTLVSDEVAMDYFTNNGMPPVTRSAAQTDQVKDDAYINGFMASTKTARLEETARLANASEVKSAITEELQAALLGQKNAEAAVQDMAARIAAMQ
jgi:ABC-type sugar transport system, periplasmic component